MKKFPVFGTAALCFILTVSCTTPKKALDNVESPKEEKELNSPHNLIPSVQLSNHSFLSDKNVGQKIEIYGLLCKGENSYYLLENAGSKSRVTFYLTFDSDDENVMEVLKNNVDKEILVKGILTKANSAWTKEMLVLEVG